MTKFTTTTMPEVSIVIPVFNDAMRLQKCLQSLEKQTYPKKNYEIIVVDNDSEDDVEQVVRGFSHAIYSHEKMTGSYAARNKGIDIASSTILGFTDADCLPHGDWIEKGVQAVTTSSKVGIIAGEIEFLYKNSNQPTTVELFETITAFDIKRFASELHFAPTANMFTRRDVFDNVGRFQALLKSGGDLQWGQRVFAAGYSIVYMNNVVVRHPARHSLRQIVRRYKRFTGGLNDVRIERMSKIFRIYWGIRNNPPDRIMQTLADHRLTSISQRCKILAIIVILKLVCILEVFRLQLGGESQRD